MTSAQLMPIVLPLVVFAVIALRKKRERPLHPGRLWIAPIVFVPLIGFGLYFAPHPVFGVADFAGMAVAGVAGFAFGWWRAHATVLRHDADTGRIMSSQSNLAVAGLAGVFLLRTGMRQALGDGGAVAVDASMLFALGMVIALRVALWRRAKGLLV